MQLKDNTIGSIIRALKTEGIQTSDLAKAIEGISEKPLRRALKEAGYEFRNKAPKGWRYVGEGKEPLHKSIFDYVKPSSSSVKSSSHKVHTEFTSSNTDVVTTTSEILPISHVIHPQFTRDEVEDLVAMLQEWRMNKQAEQMPPKKAIHDRIKELPQGNKTRKTIVIDKGIGDRLDNYCQTEKVNKSDILHLALLDFLDEVGK